MTNTKLPWSKVYRVIQDTANEYAPSVLSKQVYMSMTGILEMFGYGLWCALEEAYPEQFGELVISDEVYWASQGKEE